MADIFISSRGCVFSPKQGGKGGGWYKLEGLESSGESPILILGAQLTDSDSVLPSSAFGGIQTFYTFGRSIGDAQILGTILCGPNSGDGFAAVKSFFDGARASAAKAAVNLSVPGNEAYKIVLTGLGLTQPDGELNIQPFLFYGFVASPSNGQ